LHQLHTVQDIFIVNKQIVTSYKNTVFRGIKHWYYIKKTYDNKFSYNGNPDYMLANLSVHLLKKQIIEYYNLSFHFTSLRVIWKYTFHKIRN